MKRSEMVEEIRKILDMNGKDNGYGELERALLHHIECHGMLPPPNKAEAVTGRIVYCYYDNEQVEEEKGSNFDSLVNRSKLWDKE